MAYGRQSSPRCSPVVLAGGDARGLVAWEQVPLMTRSPDQPAGATATAESRVGSDALTRPTTPGQQRPANAPSAFRRGTGGLPQGEEILARTPELPLAVVAAGRDRQDRVRHARAARWTPGASRSVDPRAAAQRRLRLRAIPDTDGGLDGDTVGTARSASSSSRPPGAATRHLQRQGFGEANPNNVTTRRWRRELPVRPAGDMRTSSSARRRVQLQPPDAYVRRSPWLGDAYASGVSSCDSSGVAPCCRSAEPAADGTPSTVRHAGEPTPPGSTSRRRPTPLDHPRLRRRRHHR